MTLHAPCQSLAILGAGKSGLGAARLARHLGVPRVTVFDSAPAEKCAAAREVLGELGCEGVFGEEAFSQAAATAKSYDLAVLSPGLDAAWPLPAAFTAAGVTLIGEMEFACQRLTAPIVAVTGTNGKTTTTEIIALLLQAGHIATTASGNIGTALSELVARETKMDVVTLEVSSFQLETIQRFRPRAAVWLNFAPDHLDRYPDLNAYFEAKQRIFENQSERDLAVLNALEPVACGSARRVTFSSDPEKAPADFTYADGWIHEQGRPVIDFRATRLRGKHNAENLMAALAVAREFSVEYSVMQAALADYTPPRHRCELARVWEGREFLNDSKATNLHALESALRSLETSQPLILIAGGKEKGLDYAPLAGLVREKVAAVITLGQIAPKLEEAWAKSAPCHRAASVEEAVQRAAQLSAPGQTILFSPGTSSFDMFSGYEERGDVFCDAVQLLP